MQVLALFSCWGKPGKHERCDYTTDNQGGLVVWHIRRAAHYRFWNEPQLTVQFPNHEGKWDLKQGTLREARRPEANKRCKFTILTEVIF